MLLSFDRPCRLPGGFALSSGDPHPVRFESLSETIRNLYPNQNIFETVALFITEFGEDPAVILVLALVYWLYERENTMALASYVVVGIAFTLILKTGFAMPRPPEDVWLVARDYDPYGFPSGHAFNAVIIYGGLLYVHEQWRDRLLVGGSLALILGVSFSRVVLGFHYFGDIVAGALLGIVFLFAIDRITGRNPLYGFALGVLVAIPAVIFSGGEEFGLIALGAGVGGVVGTLQRSQTVTLSSRWEAGILLVGGLLFLAGVMVVQEALFPQNSPAAISAYAIVVWGVLMAPSGAAIAERYRKRAFAALSGRYKRRF